LILGFADSPESTRQKMPPILGTVPAAIVGQSQKISLSRPIYHNVRTNCQEQNNGEQNIAGAFSLADSREQFTGRHINNSLPADERLHINLSLRLRNHLADDARALAVFTAA
jgi:hypothetical protein